MNVLIDLALDNDECVCKDSAGKVVVSVLPLGIMNDDGKVIANMLCDSVSWSSMGRQEGAPDQLTLRVSYEDGQSVRAVYRLVEEVENK